MGGKGSGSPKGELLLLSGKEVIDGRLQKTDFFSFLKMDLTDYSDLAITPELALSIKNSVVRMTHGVAAAIPLYCVGKECINKFCPFHKTQSYPLFRQCLIEARMVQALTAKYIEELDVDVDSLSEMALINKLVEADIIDYRANLGLSGMNDNEAGSLLKTNIVESDSGTSETTNLHPLLEAKDKANNMRLKVLEALVGTRKEKYKKAAAMKQTNTDDAAKTLASLKATFLKSPPKKPNIDEVIQNIPSIIDADWTSD